MTLLKITHLDPNVSERRELTTFFFENFNHPVRNEEQLCVDCVQKNVLITTVRTIEITL